VSVPARDGTTTKPGTTMAERRQVNDFIACRDA
jgi:hypothetical protein